MSGGEPTVHSCTREWTLAGEEVYDEYPCPTGAWVLWEAPMTRKTA